MDFSSIDFVDLLSRIGLNNVSMTSGGIEVSYSCHRGEHSNADASPSAYCNSTTGAFYCHGCHFSGTIADLVADVQQISRATAERFLRDTYGLQFDEPVEGSFLAEAEARLRPPVSPIPRTPPPESWLSSVRLDWQTDKLESFQQYMIDRGLSRDTLTEFDIGYDYFSDRITIPIRSLDGLLFGVKGRDWTGQHGAKYLGCGDRPGSEKLRYGFNTYEITEVVFGLHRARDVRSAVLLEGELDCLALWQMGVSRSIATGSARMSVRQRNLIIDEAELVYVYYDAGSAGQEGAREAVNLLEPYVRVKVVEPLDVDPCDALRDGREDEVLRAISEAQSSVAHRTTFV